MNRTLQFAAILLLSVALAGCNLFDTASPNVVSTVKSELLLELHSDLTQPNPVSLRISTVDQECISSKLLVEHFRFKSALQVSVKGLLETLDCTEGYGVIHNNVPLVLQEGNYSIEIRLGESLNSKGTLAFDGESYELAIDNPDGFSLGHSDLRLIPEKVIWGSVSGEGDISNIIDEFNNSMKLLTSQHDLPEGYYGYFYIDNSSNISPINEFNITGQTHHFIFQLESSLADLRAALDSLRDVYGQSATIECTTWKGDNI